MYAEPLTLLIQYQNLNTFTCDCRNIAKILNNLKVIPISEVLGPALIAYIMRAGKKCFKLICAIFLIFGPKYRLWVLVRTASPIYVLSKNIKKYQKFSIFTAEKNLCTLHGQVFGMEPGRLWLLVPL